uniref:RNase H type-1 domain-containing protein n=1 Tax=Cannabis sativa TaxID=3483 RepID=A0A803P6Y0_CANSA
MDKSRMGIGAFGKRIQIIDWGWAKAFAGFGEVIQDGEGVVWATWVVGFVGDLEVAVAELLALRVGLLEAIHLGFKFFKVELDSLIVCN